MVIILIFYLFIVISSLLFYVLYVDTLSFYLLLTVIMLPFIMLITLIISRKKIKIKLVSTDTSCYCGDTTPVVLRITNDSILAISCVRLRIAYKNLLGGEAKVMTINTPVFSKNRQEICLRISTECCGMLEIELKKAKVYDMLRLFSLKLKCSNERVALMVCPKVFPLEPQVALYQNAELSEDTYSKTSPGDDPSEIFQLHEYHPGDKINRIHWKASVKQDELMVKDYSKPVFNCVAFILCNGANEHNPIETNNSIMTAAASLSVGLTENEAHHTFIWSSHGNNLIAAVKDYESYLSFLADRLSSPLEQGDRNTPLKNYLSDAESGKATRYSHIVILTPECSDELLSLLLAIDMQIKVTVICCDGKSGKDAAETLPSYGGELEVLHIDGEESIGALTDIII